MPKRSGRTPQKDSELPAEFVDQATVHLQGLNSFRKEVFKSALVNVMPRQLQAKLKDSKDLTTACLKFLKASDKFTLPAPIQNLPSLVEAVDALALFLKGHAKLGMLTSSELTPKLRPSSNICRASRFHTTSQRNLSIGQWTLRAALASRSASCTTLHRS